MNLSRLLSVTITILFAICWPGVSNAADLTLQWDPPSDGTATGDNNRDVVLDAKGGR